MASQDSFLQTLSRACEIAQQPTTPEEIGDRLAPLVIPNAVVLARDEASVELLRHRAGAIIAAAIRQVVSAQAEKPA